MPSGIRIFSAGANGWRRLGVGLLVSALALALSAPARALNLEQAVASALGSDPTFAAARARYQADTEKLPQARALLLPWVSGNVDAGYNNTRVRYSNELPRRSTNNNNYGYQLTLSQPLFDWFSWQNYKAAEQQVALAELRLEQAFQALLVRVAEAYFNVLIAEETLIALEAERASIAEQLRAAERNFELGTATITDTYEAQARYDLVEAQMLQGQNVLQIQRDQLGKLIGMAPGELAKLPPDTEVPAPVPNRIEDWVAQAEQQNLQVLEARMVAALAERGIEMARAGHYPQLSIVGSYGQNNSRFHPDSNQVARGIGNGRATTSSGTIALRLEIPIFQGGLVQSQVREAVAVQQEARYGYDGSRRDAIQATRAAFLGVRSGLAQIRALRAGEASSRKALEANQTGYEVGVRINLDVLSAQEQLFATQRDLAQARYNALLSSLELKRAAGQLTLDDISALNQLLQFRTR